MKITKKLPLTMIKMTKKLRLNSDILLTFLSGKNQLVCSETVYITGLVAYQSKYDKKLAH